MCELFQQERCSRRGTGAIWGVMRDFPLELSRDESLKHAFGQVQAIDDLPVCQ